MDQSLKQRLLGVVVVTALAAIFVPMLFDDPVAGNASEISELTIPPSPVETIDTEVGRAPETAAQVLQLPEPGYIMAESELDEINTQPIEVSDEVVSSGAVLAKPTTLSKSDKSKTASQPKKAVEAQQGLQRWYIQAASLSTEKRAKALRDDLIKQGYNAFYDTFRNSENRLFYRVRVGPELSKQTAEQLKKIIDKKNYVDSRVMQE